jgi:hypothetical protein
MRIVIISLIAVFLGCTGIFDTNPVSNTYNYADFSYFKFEQLPALGFCFRSESLYKAKIVKMSANSYRFTASEFKIVPHDSLDEPCMGYFIADTLCLTEEILPERELRPSEIEQVKRVFSAIETIPGIPEICDELSVDPCLIIECVWDANRHTDFFCSFDRLSPRQRDAVLNLLAELSDLSDK